MTKSQAEEILRVPKFGDTLHIRAVERLRQEPEIIAMRDRLVKAQARIICGACGGTADGCELCDSHGTCLVNRELADSWDWDILRDVTAECFGDE